MSFAQKLILFGICGSAISTCPAVSQVKGDRVTCTGMLINVSLDRKADFPIAIIYDAEGDYTCLIDRGRAGHDPLKPCHQGADCRFIGTSKKQIGNTYFIDKWIAFCLRNDEYADSLCKF